MNNKIWSKFYECDCGAEAIGLSYNVTDKQIYLAFFQQSFYNLNALTFKERIRSIWQIITKGTVWTDNVILNYNTAKEFGEDLIQLSKEIKDE
jgi:hypothetical protein